MSLLAQIAPTLAISSLLGRLGHLEQVLDRGVHAFLDPAADGRRIAAGGDVAEAFRKIARARTVAVVVPSPAMSEVF